MHDIDSMCVDEFLESAFEAEDILPGLCWCRRRFGYLAPLFRKVPWNDVFDVSKVVFLGSASDLDRLVHAKVSPVVCSHWNVISYL